MTGEHKSPQAGFTLVETLIASSIALVATTAVLTLFIWCGQQSALCSKMAWSQDQALRSAEQLTAYIRNASTATNMDVAHGRWVELRFPDGSWSRLTYSNAPSIDRDGRLYLQRTNATQMIVARGMTEIMDSQGFTTPVFSKSSANCIRVAYRVSEPVAGGGRVADDANFAACVQFAVFLRNVATP